MVVGAAQLSLVGAVVVLAVLFWTPLRCPPVRFLLSLVLDNRAAAPIRGSRGSHRRFSAFPLWEVVREGIWEIRAVTAAQAAVLVREALHPERTQVWERQVKGTMVVAVLFCLRLAEVRRVVVRVARALTRRVAETVVRVALA